MSREYPDFRTNLELLLEAFPQKKVLFIHEVMEYTGRSRDFVKGHYFENSKSISLPSLARKMCG